HPSLLQAMESQQSAREQLLGEFRLRHGILDGVLSPFRERIMGWRDDLVSDNPEHWRDALSDMFERYLDRSVNLQERTWSHQLSLARDLLTTAPQHSEAFVARFKQLWGGTLDPDSEFELHRVLERTWRLESQPANRGKTPIDTDEERW